ncbi:hypothetical protein J2129_002523 [Methanofollis sp. W23]|uniref:hypothetical protein n=1 Tax=Methanofollis sp. W23 TaxID=2817849 RepID=UPI001AE59DBF|nr:hypothetical protein [Methanofollis sp. W23]MBP2147069.1 hypothetical protein [Methanofollis sp. W23]
MSRHVPYLIALLAVTVVVGGAEAETRGMINIDAVEADTQESLVIFGTTNIAPGNTLQVEVTSSGFEPVGKETEVPAYGARGTVTVEAGAPLNTWEFATEVDLPPDEYTVTVMWIEGDAQASTTFTVTEEMTGTVTTTANATTSVPETPETLKTPPTEAATGGIANALGLLGAALFIRRR